MDCLQVLRHQVCLSPGHLKRAVTQYFLKMEHTSAPPQIVDCKCVSAGVQCAGRWVKPEPFAQQFHVPEHIPTPESGFPAVCKEQQVGFSTMVETCEAVNVGRIS
jgi:hypothetical protein